MSNKTEKKKEEQTIGFSLPTFNINKMMDRFGYWKTWFFIITLVLSLTVPAYYGANVLINVNVSYEQRLKAIESELSYKINSTYKALWKEASFATLIVTSGANTYHCLVNCTDSSLMLPYSTDAQIVMQYAFYNVSRWGGRLWMASANMTINGLRVTTNKTVTIEGEDQASTLFIVKPAATGAVSRQGFFTERSAILIEGSNTTAYVFLKNFRINGQCEKQTQNVAGILVRACGDFEFTDLYINGTCRFGIRNWINSGEIRLCTVYKINNYGAPPADPAAPYYNNLAAIHNNVVDSIVADCKIGWVGKSGILLNKGVGIFCGTSNTITRNWIWSCRTAIFVGYSDNHVDNNFIEANYENGIQISTSAYANDNMITNNEIRMGGTYDGNRHNGNTLIAGSGVWNWNGNFGTGFYEGLYVTKTSGVDLIRMDGTTLCLFAPVYNSIGSGTVWTVGTNDVYISTSGGTITSIVIYNLNDDIVGTYTTHVTALRIPFHWKFAITYSVLPTLTLNWVN